MVRYQPSNVTKNERPVKRALAVCLLVALCFFRHAQILGLVKCEDAVEDDAQEDEANHEAAALAKGFCELDHGDDGKHDVRNRDQQEEELPAVAPGDLEEHVEVIKRDDRGPAGFARFFEDLPHGDNAENGKRQTQNRHTGSWLRIIVRIKVLHINKSPFVYLLVRLT
ncbi:hypothetical protein SDC9_151038 [bioreactor metagenome]|uniref:Uncharacterized protein n=1 Tax=bioreactor metagenome TaxID=1076179 RepID=A0A645ETH4_9ZZZZ